MGPKFDTILTEKMRQVKVLESFLDEVFEESYSQTKT